jgi:hypothetical protein
MKTLFTGAATALVFGAAALVAPAAHAGSDYKMYHGSDCKVFGATSWADLNFTGFGVKNIAATPRNIICPLTKDMDGSIDGITNTGSVHFHLQSPATASSISCTLYTTSFYDDTSYNTFGTGGKNYAAAMNDYWTITLPNGFGDYTHEKYYMLCTLGPSMRLLGYYLLESGAATNTP